MQLFLLMCFMSSCDTFVCKNIFTSHLALCQCILRPSFLFYCFVKIQATCAKFLGIWPTPLLPSHLAKNCPYTYLLTVSTAFVLLFFPIFSKTSFGSAIKSEFWKPNIMQYRRHNKRYLLSCCCDAGKQKWGTIQSKQPV